VGRRGHVLLVLTSTSATARFIALENRILSVLVEAPVWEHYNFVVEQSAHGEQNEAGDLPEQPGLKSKTAGEDPDGQRAGSVNR